MSKQIHTQSLPQHFLSKKRHISVAHSPDADDLFMYYALNFGWVDSTQVSFSACAKDIQTLNDATLRGEYDISAISFALYPLVCDDYALLRTGVSFGNGYGPKLIKKRTTTLKKDFKVALSGAHTTNALLFKLAYPHARIVYKNFLEIESSVLSGEVHAGVLIHESILEYDESLVVEAELWDIWCDLNKRDLPLPLGGMALRRSLPLTIALECESMLTKAVEVAVHNKALLSRMLLERNLIRVDSIKLETYLNLYANADSITLSAVQLEALDVLFHLGFSAGLYPQPITAQQYMLPREYLTQRYS
ncbi:menaquinone biosynthesis family protein [uncultured Helicobacter sp.]|uniref:menaquinone biosynthesis family protein n=1 Tax=uncultured Helicobacter sp. TaxID=175537 RepID=UPI00374EF547